MVQNHPRTGRPRGFDTHETLEEVMYLFWKGGFEGTSLQAIEDATGLSRSSVYNAFGSKEELFSRALMRYRDRVQERVIGPLSSGTRGLDDIDMFLDRLPQEFGDPPGCLILNSLSELGASSLVAVRHGEAYLDSLRTAISSALMRAVRLGEIERRGIESRGTLVFGLVLAISVVVRSGARAEFASGLLAAGHYLIETWRLR